MDDRTDSLQAAVECFRARRDREEHPDGEFTGPPGNRAWTIAPTERRECCATAKPNDLGGRQKFIGHWLNRHCRTIAHVANLYGVTENDLRKALKAKPKPSGQQDLF